jgi:DNA replication protein DnaC
MPLLTEVHGQLLSLNMHHAAQALTGIIDQSQQEGWGPLKTINTLLSKERDNRAEKARDKRMKDAGFPYKATIEGFDFGFQRSVSKKHMIQLKELSWLESAFNIMFIGPPGIGKSHLAVALGIAAVDAGYKTVFVHAQQLTHIFRTLEISSKSKLQLKKITQANLVILDEVGFQPITRQEANMLFGIVNQLYQQTSIILTSNKGVAEWGEFMGDPVITAAMLDRLMHKCEIFDMDGDSYRLAHRERIIKTEPGVGGATATAKDGEKLGK